MTGDEQRRFEFLLDQMTDERKERLIKELRREVRWYHFQRRFTRLLRIPPDIAFLQGLLCFATLALVPMPPRSSPGVIIATAYILSLVTAIVLWRFLNPPAPAEEKRWRTF